MIGIIALLVLFLAAGWEAYYRNHWIKGITVKLHFPVPAVYEGREAHLEEVIANRKRMPVPVLEVAYRVRGLALWVTAAYLAFVVAYIAFMTDLFPGDELPGLAIAMLILFVLALIFWLAVRFKALRRAGGVWRTLAAISDEVIA